jgi:hypothetical protein
MEMFNVEFFRGPADSSRGTPLRSTMVRPEYKGDCDSTRTSPGIFIDSQNNNKDGLPHEPEFLLYVDYALAG